MILSLIQLEDLWKAWEHVKENAGCAGSDGVTIFAFSRDAAGALAALLQQVQSKTYRPFPLLKILIEKRAGSGGPRLLLVPAVRDRVLQTAIARHLSRSFEEEFLECSFAYRPGRSVDRAIARIRHCHELGYRYVVDADIASFFAKIDHHILLDRFAAAGIDPDTLDLVSQWVAADVWDGDRINPLLSGVPQGSPISPLLANLFLQDFDVEMEKSGRKLVRYADDFLILARTPDEAGQSLRQTVDVLALSGLDLNLEKTRVTDFESGFRFLGAFFLRDATWIPWKRDRHAGKLLFMARPMPLALRRKYESAAGPAIRKPRLTIRPHAMVARISTAQRNKPVAFLYLIEQGSVLRKSSDRLLVEKEDQVLLDLPYHKLEHIAVFGNVQVTTQAMAEILERGIHLGFFSRHGEFRGSLSGPQGKNIPLRVAQFEQYHDSARALSLARAFVAAKIRNGMTLLSGYRKSHPVSPEWDQGSQALAASLTSLESAADHAALDGVEGSAARRYFQLLMHFNRSGMVWNGRVKHPATDPLNALLSLTYTLLTHELASLLEAAGLDAYLGFLHQPDYGRPSLALDLIEAFRHAVADHFVLNLVNLQRVKPPDFQMMPNGGLFLAAGPSRVFFAAYEEWMLDVRDGYPCFRDALRSEVQRFSAAIRSRTEFRPFAVHQRDLDPCDTSSVTI